MEQKMKGPIKGAGRKWAARIKEIGQQKPPQDLIDRLNGTQKMVCPGETI